MSSSHDSDALKREFSLDDFADLLEHFGGQVSRRTQRSTCPAHGGDNPAALHYDEQEGIVVWNCFTRSHGGDVFNFVMERMDLGFAPAVQWLFDWSAKEPSPSPRSLTMRSSAAITSTTRYQVHDGQGVLVATHVREDRSDGSKGFRWECNGSNGLKGRSVVDLPLYGSELLSSVHEDVPVFVTEGEKAAEALRSRAFCALASTTGASATPGEAALSVLRGRDVILWPDHDSVGRSHMEKIATALSGIATRIRTLTWGQNNGDDAADFFERGGKEEELRAMIASAPDWEPTDVESGSDGPKPILIRFSEVEPESVSWLWEGRIPFGKLTIIDGIPGVGKSTLTMDLAARVSSGRELPGGGSSTAANVVILSGEDGLADTILPRLQAAGADVARILALTAIRLENGSEVFPTLSGNLRQIEQAIVGTEARIVIVDPLMAFLGPDVNSYSDQAVRQVLAPCARIAEETEAAIVFVRHPRKSTEGGAINSGGGSIGITGAARSVLLVGRHPDDAGLPEPLVRRVVASVKSNNSPAPPSIAFRIVSKLIDDGRITTSFVEWDAEPVDVSANEILVAQQVATQDRTELEGAKEFLLQQLADGPLPTVEVSKAASEQGISGITLKRARKTLGITSEKQGYGGSWVLRLPGSVESEGASPSIPEEDHLPRRRSPSGNDPLRDALIASEIGRPSTNPAKDCPEFKGTTLREACGNCGGRYASHRFDWPSGRVVA